MIGPVFTQIYGQTECLGNGTALWRRDHDPDRHPERMSSCGRALPHTRITLRDLDGGPVEVGQPGELCIWSPTIMKGYWRAPELTGQTIRDGWLHTGDVATVDDEGYYYIVDRMKDMIITGGFNVFPREVEDVLTGHPAVSGVAVIGVPHDKWGEEIKAVVMVRPGHSVEAAELIELVRERRGPHYAPKSVDFLDMLPLSGVGKVDKKALRASYWQGQERNVH
jgi:fatty-acyl-CoA synthase